MSTHSPGWQERQLSSRALHRVGDGVAHSGAGTAAAVLAVGWLVVGIAAGFPDWWGMVLYSATGLTTFVMVFVIQHTQARQTIAMQRKLDEVLRSSRHADNSVIAIEEAPDADLKALADASISDRENANAARAG
ncbi:MAG: low affinity iron permease family protein [Acidimicrobiales bacterium]